MIITESLKQAFELRGVINIKNFLSADKVVQAQAYSRQQFEQEGLWRDGKWNISADSQSKDYLVSQSLLSNLKNQLFADLLAEAQPLIYTLLDGQSTSPGTAYPQPLVSFPNADSWSVPYKAWHLDCPRLSSGTIPGIQVFAYLELVVHGGAATLAVMGSHRLLNDRGTLRSKDVVKLLKNESYFRKLMSKNTEDRHLLLDESDTVGDVELQLAEMVGEPGDIYLMDLRVVHAGSPNASSKPRVMLTQRFYLESAQAELNA